MKLTLTINCDNAAFDEDPNPEAARILGDAIKYLNQGFKCATLRDINGSKVGRFDIEEDE